MRFISNTFLKAAMLPAIAAAGLGLAGPAGAQQAASEGSGEAPRGALAQFSLSNAKPLPVPKVTDEAARAPGLADEASIVRSLTAVGRSADGKQVKVPPSQKLIDAAKGGGMSSGGMSGGAKPDGKAADPAFTEGEEADRQVFGEDDRIQIGNNKSFPFRTVGFIIIETQSGGQGSCSGTLIGPRTVLTAAHCLYEHDDGGWVKNLTFVPAVNGEDNNPFGGFEYETAYVQQGFIDNYKENYGSVTPWDIGLITLKEPVGDSLGWMNFANVDDLGDFNVNIVGYPGDKPLATMWRSTCDVTAENVDAVFFTYDCDTYPGSSGSSVYAYDNASKQRVVVGINIAESPDYNLALRIGADYVEWINGLMK